jgi:hypothetical protein
LLAKARLIRFPVTSYYRDLGQLFDLNKPESGDLPIASLTRLIDGVERPEGIWMRADPVHLATGSNGLRMADASNFSLTQHDAIVLAAALEEFFKEQHWKLEVPQPGRWYVRLPQKPAIVTTEIDRVAGRDVRPWLPDGPDRRIWDRLMNEIQMLLHACEVNREREQRGELPVNSLWFWGIGSLPEILNRKWTRIYSDDPAAHGLAMLSGTKFEGLPDSMHYRVSGFAAAGNVLVASATRMYGNARPGLEAWLQSMEELERQWFAPILQALRAGALERVRIITDGHQFTVHRASLLKFWRLREPIVDYMI